MEIKLDDVEIKSDLRELFRIWFFEKLTVKERNVLFTLILDLLPETKKTSIGNFVNALLQEEQLSISGLANEIFDYLHYCNPRTFYSKENAKSFVQKLTKSKSSENSELIKSICLYFSISEETIFYGTGVKYSFAVNDTTWNKLIGINLQDLSAESVNSKIDDALNELVTTYLLKDKKYKEENPTAQKLIKKYIRHSHIKMAEIIQETYGISQNDILQKESYLLWKETDLIKYLSLLKPKEYQAVIHALYGLSGCIEPEIIIDNKR